MIDVPLGITLSFVALLREYVDSTFGDGVWDRFGSGTFAIRFYAYAGSSRSFDIGVV